LVVTQLPAAGTVLTGDGTTQLVTITVADANGNTASCDFTLTLDDDTAPTISCPGDITTGVDVGECFATVTWTPPVGTDNCAVGLTTTQTGGSAPGSTFPVGTSTIEYTVTDGGGNTAVCSFDVTVVDDEDPVITCPADITTGVDAGNCTAVVTYTIPSGTDNCPGATTTQTDATGLSSGDAFPVGTTTLEYTVTDAAGNTAVCSFDVTVTDDEDPVIACPGDITTGVDAGNCTAVVTYTVPSGTDNCPGATTTQTDATGLSSGDAFPVGTTTLEYTVTDAAGNTAVCSFDVTVVDDEDPVITVCPSDAAVSADASCEFTLLDYTGGVTATDNCTAGGSITISQSPLPGTVVSGTQVVTMTADDGNGNTSTCQFTLTVDDTTDPTITDCPVDATVLVDGSCEYTVPDYTGIPTVDDNCTAVGSLVVTQLPAAGTVLTGDGTTQLVTITVADANGNTASCDFTLTLDDDTAPTGTRPAVTSP